MSKERLYGVVCYWLYDTITMIRPWKLVESFVVDSDSHCLSIPSTGGDGGIHEHHKWLNKKEYNKGDWDWKPIMGRAATIWTMECGVRLLDINPPTWCEWLSISFYEEICKLQNWSMLLTGGHELYLGTVKEAETYLDQSLTNWYKKKVKS